MTIEGCRSPGARPRPDRVRALARGARLDAVWENERGGVTFRTDDGRHIKHGPRNAETSFAGEARRLEWAARHIVVPQVIEVGADETHEWLVTATLAGRSAVDPRWVADPPAAVRAVGEGLRALHDALPVDECPFDWSVPSRIANAAGRGIRLPGSMTAPPPIDRLVVCHGDAAARTPSSARTAGGRDMSTSARWASPIAGRIWPWRR